MLNLINWLQENIFNKNILSLTENSENINKWIPNNDLYIKYNNLLNKKAELNRLNDKIENKLIPKSKEYLKEYMFKIRSNDANDKIACRNLKKEMLILDNEIKKTEELIKEINLDEIIINDWEEYVKKAENYIIENDILNIHVNDILSDEKLLLFLLKELNNYNTNNINSLNEIKKYFEINSKKIFEKFENEKLNDNTIIYELNIDNTIIELGENMELLNLEIS